MNAEELKAWRAAHGLSQSELARWLGITRPRLENWEQNHRKIDPMLPLALCEVERRLKAAI